MKDKIVIDVWLADLTFPGYMERLHKLGRQFDEAHPEYHINIRGCDFRTLPQAIAQSAAHGYPPAIAEGYFYLGQTARDMRARNGRPLFTSVEKAIAGRTEILGEPVVIDDIIPAVRDYYTYRGDLTSMPSVATTSLIFANKTVLDAAGLAEAPQTWDDVDAACELIAKIPGGPEHAITWSNHGTFIQQTVAAQGGQLVDQDNGRSGRARTVDLASTEMVAWATWWQRLHKNGHYLHTGKIPDWEGTFKAFATQEVGLRISSSNDVNYMVQAASKAGFELEVGRFPDNNDAEYAGNAIAGTSLWLTDGLDQATRDGALAFLQYMHNPRNAADRHQANSFVPITHASFDLLEREGWFDKHPYHRAASDQLKTFPPQVVTAQAAADHGTPLSEGAIFGDFAGIQDVMTRAMQDVLVHGVDPAIRLTEATGEAQRLLDAYDAAIAETGPRTPDTMRVEFFTGAEPYSGADMENVVQLRR